MKAVWQAVWNGVVVAESGETVVVEGNHYFPAASLRLEHFEDSATTTHCSWKGEARYKTLVIGERRNADAAWYYPDPRPAAAAIRGRFAFWRGVDVVRQGT